jgi:hypothetical protein
LLHSFPFWFMNLFLVHKVHIPLLKCNSNFYKIYWVESSEISCVYFQHLNSPFLHFLRLVWVMTRNLSACIMVIGYGNRVSLSWYSEEGFFCLVSLWLNNSFLVPLLLSLILSRIHYLFNYSNVVPHCLITSFKPHNSSRMFSYAKAFLRFLGILPCGKLRVIAI